MAKQGDVKATNVNVHSVKKVEANNKAKWALEVEWTENGNTKREKKSLPGTLFEGAALEKYNKELFTGLTQIAAQLKKAPGVDVKATLHREKGERFWAEKKFTPGHTGEDYVAPAASAGKGAYQKGGYAGKAQYDNTGQKVGMAINNAVAILCATNAKSITIASIKALAHQIADLSEEMVKEIKGGTASAPADTGGFDAGMPQASNDKDDNPFESGGGDDAFGGASGGDAADAFA